MFKLSTLLLVLTVSQTSLAALSEKESSALKKGIVHQLVKAVLYQLEDVSQTKMNSAEDVKLACAGQNIQTLNATRLQLHSTLESIKDKPFDEANSALNLSLAVDVENFEKRHLAIMQTQPELVPAVVKQCPGSDQQYRKPIIGIIQDIKNYQLAMKELCEKVMLTRIAASCP